MLGFAEEPRDVLILDENGDPLTAGDTERRFLKHRGCINTMVNITFHTPLVIHIYCVMLPEIIRMVLLCIKE